MKSKLCKLLPCLAALFVFSAPLFSQSVLVDVITKEQAIKIMQEEMVTVIPKGKKTNLDDFAGTSGTQVINAYEIAKHEVELLVDGIMSILEVTE